MMFVLVLFFLLCMGTSFVSCDRNLRLKEDANYTTCIEKERQALLSFKANLVDINNDLNIWEEIRDCCEWWNVICDYQTRHVIELHYSSTFNRITGKFSPSLQLLQQLEYLDLSGIDFQSNSIPDFLGSLANLRHLDLSTSNLSGRIPPQLANLSNLTYLDLSGIDFHSNSITDFLGSLANLRHLDLSASNLSGRIPHQLANLSNLTYLDLSHNSLEGPIPFPFGDLTSLTYLDLSNNHLNESLPNFSGCSSLTSLSLGHNSFNGSIPDFTPFRQSLQKLDLSSNQLTGNLPKSVGQLSNLEYLDVSSNSDLEGVISDLLFLNLTNLAYLDLSFNSFAFELRSISSQLETIKLQSCKLGPSFPMWIQNQTSFEYLDISRAEISDSVPAWFWNLPSRLKFLDLSSNKLKGMLPDMTSHFDGYPGMDLSYNQLEGRIPLLPSKLSALNLSGNRFSGNLSFLCQIDEELTLLDLSNNLLSGRLPDCWLNFQKRLVVLNLSNNTLSEKIPPSLGLLSQLEALYLRSNAFVGELPISLSNCTKLRFADFGENKLSGMIPTWIGERLSNLSFLVLQSNSFYGPLPSQLCWLNNLHVLDLSKNGFSGNIPRCFDNFTAMAKITFGDDITNHSYNSYMSASSCKKLILCIYKEHSSIFPVFDKAVFIDNAWVAWKGTKRNFERVTLQLLRSIDLSDNKLSGELPYEITSLQELVSLNLSINKLHGELPRQMGLMKSLEILDLSINKFSGNISSSLSEITYLGYLNLSNNNFSGRIPTGPQLQRFDCSSYSGNPHLNGPPLTPGQCGLPPATIVVGKEHNREEKEDGDELWESYYIGMGTGFVVGFWGICATIFFNRSCRHFLFASLTHIKDWIYVTVALHYLKLERKFKRF